MSKEKKNIADHPFFVWMGFVGDVAALSVLWLVCCIPLVTIGASTTAAFSVAGKMAAKDDYLIIRDFLAALKRDWKQATLLWGILAVAAMLIVTNYQIGLANPGSMGGALIAVSAALGVCLISVAGASFSLLGRFSYLGVRTVLTDAVRLCLANPATMLLWLGLVLWLPVSYYFIPAVFFYLRLPWLFLGGGTCITAFSFAIRPFFRKLERKR